MGNLQKRFSATHNSENFPEFSQNSHFRHVGFYYSGAEKSVPFWTLFAGEHFAAQNAFSGPKMHFGPQNAFWGPKMHFGVLFAPWPQMLMKQMVSASEFRLFGVKCENEHLFALWAPKVEK